MRLSSGGGPRFPEFPEVNGRLTNLARSRGSADLQIQGFRLMLPTQGRLGPENEASVIFPEMFEPQNRSQF